MENNFINITKENIDKEHISCIIRSKISHPGISEKKEWLKSRLQEGHVFRKLNVNGAVFIEYSPIENAWVPIIGKNYMYIYCLWTLYPYKGKGYGKQLMEYCINDAKAKGKSGICVLASEKQKAWLTDQKFAKKFGFKTVDKTEYGYELLALSFNDDQTPSFTNLAKKGEITSNDLTIYYDMQCPFLYEHIENIKKYCIDNNINVSINKIDTLEKAKQLPCVFNNYAILYKGKFQTVNILLDLTKLERILNK